MHIHWDELAEKLGAQSNGSTALAEQALCELLGSEAIERAVEHYIRGETGSELVRSVLWHLHPAVAMDYCHRIYREDPDLNRRRLAVELLRVVADARALPWAEEFLNDPDPEIAAWGAGLVDQLVLSGRVEVEDFAQVFETMAIHPNQAVRERLAVIQDGLATS